MSTHKNCHTCRHYPDGQAGCDECGPLAGFPEWERSDDYLAVCKVCAYWYSEACGNCAGFRLFKLKENQP